MPVLRVNDYDMAYVEAGAGAPMVLVHGTLSDYRYWGLQMAALGKVHRLIAVSLRHHYPERWDGVGSGDMAAEHIADLGAFIAALGAGPSISSAIRAPAMSALARRDAGRIFCNR